MRPTIVYGLVAVGVICLALYSLITRTHLVPRLIAANIMGSGVFLLFVALAQRGAGVDPVPHAMVLTGIVVAVAATGLAMALLRRVYAETGATTLPEDRPDAGDEVDP